MGKSSHTFEIRRTRTKCIKHCVDCQSLAFALQAVQSIRAQRDREIDCLCGAAVYMFNVHAHHFNYATSVNIFRV